MVQERQNIKKTIKAKVLTKQNNKCANKPNANLFNIFDYKCPMWKVNNGNFDESGYEMDHIIEYSIGGSDEETNLQALCQCCHTVKTKNFNKKSVPDGSFLITNDQNKLKYTFEKNSLIISQKDYEDDMIKAFENTSKDYYDLFFSKTCDNFEEWNKIAKETIINYIEENRKTEKVYKIEPDNDE